ncbi:hypothetical protein [Falsiroseomonas sp.]|uniref:hypothetical protein n=1 Tax=Falsiroseomonas sp. TaxID=2870721 RepID=UPI00271B0853|nr:hypothetical protein [Falsiroseomonas sp.]MDO9500271.1 hypothetical protein [Falsiroseomonas sp.]
MKTRTLATRAIPSGGTEAEALFARIPVATSLCGLSRATLYREAGRGNLVMKKAGRTTLVCLTSLRAFMASLPQAEIRPPHQKAG